MIELTQPNADRLPDALLDRLVDSVAKDAVVDRTRIVFRDQHSNDFAEIPLRGGPVMIVKRGRFDWAGPRFDASRIASGLIRGATELTVPAPLPIPSNLDPRPVEAYWRIDLPTLDELWGELEAHQKPHVLRTLGEATARLHSVEIAGAGPLPLPAEQRPSLEEYLGADLEQRLLPAVTAEWPGGAPIVEALLGLVGELESRVGERRVLIHNDLHMGNVLCEEKNDVVRCVGFLDLETALAGPPEADIAAMQVHHGTLFDHPVEGDWIRPVLEGYGEPLDVWGLAFYRALHLLNMGFYSALIGHEWHADQVAAAAGNELDLLRTGPSLTVATNGR